MEVELSPASPAPLIQAEHSYSLCGDSRPQSPLTHISTDDNFNEGDLENEEWCLATELTPAAIKTEPVLCETSGLAPSVSLTVTATSLEGEQPELQTDMKPLSQKVLPEIKLEPHEVDQFLNLSSKEGLLITNSKWHKFDCSICGIKGLAVFQACIFWQLLELRC
uniref:cAMP responsive element binding protein 3 like 2 n=1 Tax=Buteo japonicus TaxID=224669 RepID=A0A8C0BML5_9AVES